MTPEFLWAVQQLFLLEGYESDDPRDRGGPTILGISSKYWPEWHKKLDDCKTYDEQVKIAKCFYWTNYWKRHKLDDIGDKFVAYEFFETSVHTMTGARKIEGQVLSDLRCGSLKEAAEKWWVGLFLIDWNWRQYQYYRDSAQTHYFRGWMRRCFDMVGEFVQSVVGQI